MEVVCFVCANLRLATVTELKSKDRNLQHLIGRFEHSDVEQGRSRAVAQNSRKLPEKRNSPPNAPKRPATHPKRRVFQNGLPRQAEGADLNVNVKYSVNHLRMQWTVGLG